MHIILVLLLAAAAFLNQAYAESLAPEPAPQLSATNFAFPSFDTQSCSSSSNLLCLGAVTAHDGFLSLTPEPSLFPGFRNSNKHKVGWVLYRQPVVVWPAFLSTVFKFRIVVASNSSAGDGVSFLMLPVNRPSLDDLGIVGQPNTKPGSDIRQLTVRLDTYKNNFDIDGNHITVDTASVERPLIAASPNGSGIDLKSGKVIKVQIDYNSWTKWLEVHAGYESNPLEKIVSRQIDVTGRIPNSMYVGFAAVTQNFAESHQLLSWEFKSTTKWNH
ncbi:probable L-type lectin-domain containing receptor kinase S.5 [Tripterygium wilfordii]|uniref:probable L-type lectin-domain containing receptor kinase S.5 n=1 Tax=Tripterygium wilfordii TaxID=458696 RepID=UPI0018F85B17|nr:probable L-type lectin-domain containing receptor kinase S.5 [Tripterygium wilfordii]